MSITAAQFGVNCLSASGGWSSTPNGGFITFSGNATYLGTPYSHGGIIGMPGVGIFRVASVSDKTTVNGTIQTVSFVCDIAFRQQAGPKGALGSCVEYKKGKTLNEIVSDLGSMVGLANFSLPIVGGNPIYESVWLREGQSAFQLLEEILTANGIVCYAPNGVGAIVAVPLVQFAGQLSGSGSNLTIDTTDLAFPSRVPSGLVISGSKDIKVDKKSTVDTTNTILTGTNVDWNITSLATTVNKVSEQRDSTSRTVIRTEIAESEDPNIYNQRVTTEKYELKSPIPNKFVPLDVGSCYPNDPGRILKRDTVVSRDLGVVATAVYSAFYGSINGENKSKDGTGVDWDPTLYVEAAKQYTGTPVVTTHIEEVWEYNNRLENIYFGPPGYINTDISEYVKYTKTTKSLPLLDISLLATISLNTSPNAASKPAHPFKDWAYNLIIWTELFPILVEPLADLITVEFEETLWTKEPGNIKWGGSRRLYKIIGAIDQQNLAHQLDVFYPTIDNPLRLGTISSNQYIDAFLAKRKQLQTEALTLQLFETETKIDWAPQTQNTWPQDYEIVSNPYVDHIKLDGQLSGGLIQLSAGRFSTYESVLSTGLGIYLLERARTKTSTITEIVTGGSIINVGMGDSPSFSADSDGVRRSMVYLNGS
jgi:hypothetical protein